MGQPKKKRQAGAADGSARCVFGERESCPLTHAAVRSYAAMNTAHVTATAIPGSATTLRHPPMQAAKKLRIGPRLIPVPPAESPVDGAGPLRGRKDGPPDSYLGPLNPHGSPFFFGFQKPFFFQQGSEMGFDRFLRDHLTHPHPAAAPPPSPFQGEGLSKRCL